jgi:hypothetical protein
VSLRLVLVAALIAAPVAAHAGPTDLRVRRLPGPRGLRMRVAQPTRPGQPATGTTTRPSRPGPTPPTAGGEIAKLVRRQLDTEKAPLSDRLVVRLDLGLAVDGTRVSGKDTLDGQDFDGPDDNLPLLEGRYDSVRSYGLGEIYLGSRGIGAASLSTYTASQLRFAKPASVTTPLASPYDTVPDFQSRVAWIETDGLFTSRWLKPVRVRAGRMYVYGPTIVHVDGLLIAWEGSWFEASTWAGGRVADYHARDITSEDQDIYSRTAGVSGSELRADLHRFHLPVVLDASTMYFRSHTHSDLSGTLVPRKGVVVRSSSRFEDGRLARQRLVVRARVSEDSTIIVDNQLRTKNDWFWDYASLKVRSADENDADVDIAARRYLDLGEQRPRYQAAVQAGTVILQNLDLLARGALALDLENRNDGDLNPHLPEYVEGGVGIEVRVRRALALMSSAMIRDYKRPVPHGVDTRATADPLPDADELGEEWMLEGGLGARYTAGARRFSAQAELYGRRTRWAPVYGVDGQHPEVIGLHGGGRIFVDAWVNPRVRLRVEYDLSTILEVSPEFRGLKQLRLWLEGTY